jgi:hypothetical protein
MSGADVSSSSFAISVGMPRFSKRVLAHVHCTQQLAELGEELIHGKGVRG